jgi:hypothetical protein
MGVAEIIIAIASLVSAIGGLIGGIVIGKKQSLKVKDERTTKGAK